MQLSAFLFAAFTVLVAASPTQNAEAVSAAALGAQWDELQSAFCCEQIDCRWYDSGCAVSYEGVKCTRSGVEC